jgi:SAM-dependent methyltransferase
MIPLFGRRLLFYWRDFICRRGKARYCPVCQHTSRKFTPYGVVPRKGARCPWCGSLERHRCEWLYIVRRTDLFDGRRKNILHVAPEPCLGALLQSNFGAGYINADLNDLDVMVRMDIMNIPFSSDCFDVILSSHILLDVRDDSRVLSEFYRVLKPGRWCNLLEPIQTDPSFEDTSIVDPVDRLREYGGPEHFRRYGPDFVDRLQEAGFIVDVISPEEFVTPMELARYGMTKSADDIYFCIKQKNGQ